MSYPDCKGHTPEGWPTDPNRYWRVDVSSPHTCEHEDCPGNRLARRLEAGEALFNALLLMIEWHGGICEDDCPGDDTCRCPNTRTVNEACRAWESTK